MCPVSSLSDGSRSQLRHQTPFPGKNTSQRKLESEHNLLILSSSDGENTEVDRKQKSPITKGSIFASLHLQAAASWERALVQGEQEELQSYGSHEPGFPPGHRVVSTPLPPRIHLERFLQKLSLGEYWWDPPGSFQEDCAEMKEFRSDNWAR